MNAKQGAMTALVVVLCAGSAHADPVMHGVYSNNFERATDIGSEWSVQNHTTRRNFSGFLGRMSWDRITLRLATPELPDTGDPGPDEPGPDEPGPGIGIIKSIARPISTRPEAQTPVTFRLRFDLYLIDSWDASHPEHGDDRMIVDINGRTLFDEALTTHAGHTNFREPDQWGSDLGFEAWNDSIYRMIDLYFTLEEGEDIMEIGFFGTAGQGMDDESWGLDNVRLDYFVGTIPAPSGVAVLLGCGMLAGVRRRR